MFENDESIWQEMYEYTLENIQMTHTTELRIHYKVGHGIFDVFDIKWSGGEPTDEYTDVLCSYREDNRIGSVVSSEIVDGYPSGNFKIFIPYENRFEVQDITNYIDNSLYFKLRPNSPNPILLTPKTNGVTIEYFRDNEKMPLTQRWLTSVQDFK